MPDRLERLTDLVLVLLNTSKPRTLDEIAHAVPGYPDTHDARRQAFERDKRVLREEGIPVVTEPVDGPDQYGYRIDPAAFYLPDLNLEPDEQAALLLAVAGVHLGDPSGRDALAKLGASGVADARLVAAIEPPPALVALFAALRSQAEVRFAYRDERRVVAPATVRFRAGRWYLVGWDRRRDAARTFRVDRIDDEPSVGSAGSGRLPQGADLALAPMEPWRHVEGDEEDHVLVWVDGVEACRVREEVGERAVEEELSDGSMVVRLGVTSFPLLRSWVLALLDHAVVVGPPSARDAVMSWLASTREAHVGDGSQTGDAPAHEEPVAGARAGTSPARKAAAPERPPPARVRLRRLLALVAWLADVGAASTKQIATRFSMSEEEVVKELELAACCGVPPYTPDALLEIVVDDGGVQAFLPKELARPRRLTPAEGLALATSARTILSVPGADRDGALGRALGKLEAVLGDRQRLVIELDPAPAHLGDLQEAVDARTQVEIEYHSASSDETTVRVVDPMSVVSFEGHWYLDAFCHRAGGVRRFRVDRIRAVRALAAPAADHGYARDEASGAFVPGPDARHVTLRLWPEAHWVADSVPLVAQQPGPGETLDVVVSVGGHAWLERLLLQLGPHAKVLAPGDLRDAGSRAASRLLARYEVGCSGSQH